MTEPFLGEIKLMSFGFAPRGWAFCNGQLLPVNQNQALFSLLGTTFGGDGRVSFALPNLQGRVPIHVSASHPLGESGGEQMHTLSTNELPSHTHGAQGALNSGTQALPTNAVLGPLNNGYHAPTALQAMQPATVANMGGSQPHENMQPFLTLNFCIALQGIFPSQN